MAFGNASEYTFSTFPLHRAAAMEFYKTLRAEREDINFTFPFIAAFARLQILKGSAIYIKCIKRYWEAMCIIIV